MKNQKIKILFLDIFTDNEELRKEIKKKVYRGKTYSEHVRGVFGLGKDQWLTLDASKGRFPAKLLDVSAIVIGGSAKDPVRGQERQWMRGTYGFIRKAVKKNLPILGICGGLQFVVRALGGEIIYNPKGKEFGAIRVTVKKADPLFAGLGKSFIVPENHKCMVGKFKMSSKLLASSKMCNIQALALGDKIRLVQFHPERTREQNLALARMTKDQLVRDGVIGSEKDYPKFIKSLKVNSKAGQIIIKNFLRNFVENKS